MRHHLEHALAGAVLTLALLGGIACGAWLALGWC